MRATAYEDLDAETRGAIEEGEAQYRMGNYREWKEVRQELRARLGLINTPKIHRTSGKKHNRKKV